ncbi:HNH endonuclease [Georgenia sp. EYE_87]|uniref:HNH endonuclease n=1 Tax=Georgenia sp. EYE_87 TaxID=2853448 RepID=UPI00200529BE|nr:HNH endonuclease signature motif containing protein [Georgenia sp. EYE_87]MCK6211171.1 HNH endonuclease [Georgenia sp. EYE_87]
MVAIEAERLTRDVAQPTTAAPAPLLTGLRTAVEGLRAGAPATGAQGWGHAEREAAITALDAVIQDLTLYRGKVLLAHREDGRWGTARDRDYADWRARTTGAGRGAALGELQVAEGLQAMPEVEAGVAAGELTLEHAKALSRLRAGASEEVRAALDSGMAADLAAKGKELSAPELAKAAQKAAATVDSRAAQESFEASWRRRAVTTTRSAGGRSGTWVLDDVSGTIVETALDTVAGAPAADDPRTRAQRLADALVTMASRTLQTGSDLNGAQIRPHIALITDEETWAAARRHRQAIEDATGAAVQAAHGSGAAFGLDADGRPRTTTDVEATDGAGPRAGGCARSGRVSRPTSGSPALPAVAPAELEDGTLVPLGELLRLMCDCEMTRVVMDADSQVLDVGLTQRTYAKEIRRAVTTRDRHCQWPGCQIRASWSEVHHIIWYSRGGPTSVENGITACSYHHHVIHRDHVRIVPLADGFAFYRAEGTLIGTTRRDARRRRPNVPPAPGSTGIAGGAAARSGQIDDRTPAPDPAHAQLLAVHEQITSSNGRLSAGLLDALTGSTAPPYDRVTPDGSTASPGDRGTPPPQVGHRGTALPSNGPPDLHAPSADGHAAVRSTAAPPGTRPTPWDASLLDQPAEPPF